MHLFKRLLGVGTMFFPLGQKICFISNKIRLFIFGNANLAIFLQIVPKISRWILQIQVICLFASFTSRYILFDRNLKKTKKHSHNKYNQTWFKGHLYITNQCLYKKAFSFSPPMNSACNFNLYLKGNWS